MTEAGHDRAHRPLGQYHAFGRTGSAPDGAADVTATLPMLRIGKTAAQPPPRTGRGLPRDRWLFLIVFLVALTIFAATNTGRIVFDTKLGVDISAGEFFSRLWSLWNPLEWFGSLQDQYIGYAVPMAPFFLAGQLLHIPVWLIERLWLALLIAVGFMGMVRLARALRIGSDSARLLAGVVFALWPTFTIALGSTSAGALPGLMVPWAILPLVPAAAGRAPAGRAAARSGLAIAAMAGINAVSTLAVLLLPAVYIVTHSGGRQRRALSLKWGVAVAAATAWWVIPLLLQARYSFNFLPYIEQSGTTTGTMSAAAVLRGTGTWTAYLNLGGSPWIPAGWSLVSSSWPILATAAISAAGLAGLARRDMPERRWLCFCAGLVAVVALAGYSGPLGGPFHAGIDDLLNGALAPFRSTYKFEPVLAVALALGCAHAMDRCWRLSLPLGRSVRLAGTAATAPIVALVLAGLALPQLTGHALQPGSFTAVPSYWYQATAYLAAHSPRETSLVVPANPHGQFTWGDTIDDPLEPLATSPWAERGLVPFGGAGSQLLLETAERAVESGQQVPGLAAYLARAGIRYIVVRNDADPLISGYTQPQVVNETLALSGFRRVAAFGPPVAASPGYPDVAGQAPGFALTYPAIEIFTAASPVLQPRSPVTTMPVSQTAVVNGGPDAPLQLAGQGVLGSTQPVVIAGQQLSGRPALWAVTDGQPRADNDFGSTVNAESYTYTAHGTNPVDDPLGAAGGQPRQLLPVPAAGHQTVAVLSGAASVTASSAGTWTGESTQYDPVNAFDGNPATAWAEASPQTPVGQWLEITFNHPIDLPPRAGIELLDDTYLRSIANQLRVTTAAGSASTEAAGTGAEQPLLLPAGPTRWLRITITGASNVRAGYPGAGITDVLIPGVRVSTFLQPAEDPAGGTAPAVAYSFSQPAPSPYEQAGQAGQGAVADLNRIFVTPTAARLTAKITAVPEPGSALASLITRLSPATKSEFRVSASSSWAWLPEFGPGNLFDKAAGKPWLAGAGDTNPTLQISWRGRRTIRELVLQPALGLAAEPTGVLVGSPVGARLASVGLGGVVRVSPPLRTDKLYLSFGSASSSAAGNTAAGQPAVLPIGLAKVTVPALAGLHLAVPATSTPFRLACGQGPAISVAGLRYRTSVTGTIGDLTELKPVQLRLCTPGGAITLPAGRQRLTAAPSADFAITGLSLSNQLATTSTAPDLAAQPRAITVLSWQSDNRTLRIGPGATSYVEVHENVNPGWQATLNGHPLTAATLDGWQQAFVVPAGQGGTIRLTFAPASAYHAGLIGSGIALLILLAFAIGTGWGRGRRAGEPQAESQPDGGHSAGEIHAREPGRAGLVFRIVAEQPSAARRHTGHRAGQRSRPGQPAPRPSRAEMTRYLATALPLAIVIFVAGGPVAIAVPVLAIVEIRWGRWRPAIAAGAMIAAGIAAAAMTSPATLGSGPFSGPAQVCALVALGAALLPALRSPAAGLPATGLPAAGPQPPDRAEA